MFGKFLGDLAERLAYPFVKLAERLGSAVSNIGEALQGFGVKIEAGALRRLEGAEAEQRAQSAAVLGVADTDILDPLGIPEALTKMRNQYAWTFKTDYLDTMGNRISRFTTVSTNELLSEAQARQVALDDLEDGDYAFRKGSLISISVERVVKAGIHGTL